MTLAERISAELKSAMLARDAQKVGTLRLLKSALGYAQIKRQTDQLPDAEVIALIQKEVKKRRDSIEQFEKGGRPELAAKEQEELAILEHYLPEPLTPSELEQLVRDTIRETGATSKKDLGPVIKAVQAKTAGRAEGKAISSTAARLLP